MINGKTNRDAALHYCRTLNDELREMDQQIHKMIFDDKSIPYGFQLAYVVGNRKPLDRLWDLVDHAKPRRAKVLAEVGFIRDHIARAYAAISKKYAPKRPDAE